MQRLEREEAQMTDRHEPEGRPAELRTVASQVQFHLTGILYYRQKFFRGSPFVILLPGEWRDAVPGRFSRATEALGRWDAG